MPKYHIKVVPGPVGWDGYGVYFRSAHGGDVLLAWFRSNGEARAYVAAKEDIS